MANLKPLGSLWIRPARMHNPRIAWRRVLVPGGLLLIVFILHRLEVRGLIPSRSQIAKNIGTAFSTYGLVVVAGTSFIENLGGLNIYFPGSIAILGAMAMTAGKPVMAARVFGTIVSFSFLAHSTNFFIGRAASGQRSWKLSGDGRIPEAIRKWGFPVVFWLATCHPHPTALVTLLAGAKGVSYRTFLKWFLPPFCVWNVFWGILMYTLGGLSTNPSLAGVYIGLLAIAVWFFLECLICMRQLLGFSRSG